MQYVSVLLLRNSSITHKLLACIAFLTCSLCGNPRVALCDDSNDLNVIERIYEAKSVSEINIEIDAADWEVLRTQKREFAQGLLDPNSKPFDNFSAKLSIDGIKLGKIQVRKKGFIGSLDDDFPSLRVRLGSSDSAAAVLPHHRLTLNNNKQDPSLLSQFLSYQFFNRVGVPAPRVGFAVVKVNGTNLGVYSVVEPVDKPFLQSRFGGSDGDLHEGTLSDFSAKSIERLELKSGPSKEPKDWKVQELAQLLTKEVSTLADFEQLIDLEEFFRFWVAESLIGAWDGYCSNENNYFVYHRHDSDRLVFMPWGADSAWMNATSPFSGFGNAFSTSIYVNSLLPHRLFHIAEGEDRYVQTLHSILDEHWHEAELYSDIDRIAKMIEPFLHARQQAAGNSQKAMKRFIQTRRKKIERELNKGKFVVADEPRKAMYATKVGSIQGSFKGFWNRPPKGELASGNLESTLNEKSSRIEIKQAIAKKVDFGVFGPKAGGKNSTIQIELKGMNEESLPVTLNLSLGNRGLPASEYIQITGTAVIGAGGGGIGPFGGPNTKWIRGRCMFSEAKEGRSEPVNGTIELELFQVRGGFFGQ